MKNYQITLTSFYLVSVLKNCTQLFNQRAIIYNSLDTGYLQGI